MAWWAWLLIAIAVLVVVVPIAVSAKDVGRYLRLRRM